MPLSNTTLAGRRTTQGRAERCGVAVSRAHIAVLAIATLLVNARTAAGDDTWLVAADVPAAFAVSTPQQSLFGPGAMPSIGAYRSIGAHLLFGARVRAGALTDGDAPMDATIADPEAGGLGGVSVNLRVRPLAGAGARRGDGLWLEVSGGVGLTGDLVRPTAEVGVGWGIQLGSANLGPSLRYLYVHQTADPLDSSPAGLLLVGVEMTLFDSNDAPSPSPTIVASAAPTRAPQRARVPEPAPVTDTDGDGLLDDVDACPDAPEDVDGFADEDGCPDPDNDGDAIADVVDDCPLEPEVVNGVDDRDGCPDEGLIVLVQNRIVLEERVLFDENRARVKSRAKPVLRAIVELWAQHPEWDRMVIEGHADKRGTEEFNLWLSELRADRVKDELVELGMPAASLEAVGKGESMPVSTRNTKEAYEKNRRVEFVIVEEHEQVAPVDGGAAGGKGQ